MPEPAAGAGSGDANGDATGPSADQSTDSTKQAGSGPSGPSSSGGADASSSQQGSQPGQAAADAAPAAVKPALRMPSLPQRAAKTSKPPAAATARQEGATSSTNADAAGSAPSTSAPGTPKLAARALGPRTSSGGRPAGITALPPRMAPASAYSHLPQIETAVDPAEAPSTQLVRARVHDIRVGLIRAARRLGYDPDNGIVKQVLYRLFLAEKLKEPFRKNVRKLDPAVIAQREATRLEIEQGPDSALGLDVSILLIGLSGTGKTQLIRSLLSSNASSNASSSSIASTENGSTDSSSSSSASSSGSGGGPDAFAGETRRVEVHRGSVHGIGVRLIDTPGLHASASDFAMNNAALRAIKGAFRRHKPDLVIYVDRFDHPTCNGSEVAVLQALTAALGPGVWLNTVIALTHAGSVPACNANGAPMGYDAYAQKRSHLLQLVIRAASGDARLMNPIAFVESHPACSTNEQGQLIIPNGLPWQQHLLLMVVSAKLLADTEVALQMQGSSGAITTSGGAGQVAGTAAMQQMMGGGRQGAPPVRYLMGQLTQFAQPLTFTHHGAVMELRHMQHSLKHTKGARAKKDLHSRTRMRLLQLSRILKRQQQAVETQARASKAGGKVTAEPARLARITKPAMHREASWRYRVPEAKGGWIARPQIEPHAMDNSDNIEGFMLDKAGVWRPEGADLTSGVPYRHSMSAQTSKEQVLVQSSSHASVYHNMLGTHTSNLSLDMQTSGTAGTPDLLYILRADTQYRGIPFAGNAPGVGLMLSRLAEECRPHRGPLALGARLQNSMRVMAPRGVPVELDTAIGKVLCRPSGSMEREDAWGAAVELRTDAHALVRSRWSAPLSIAGSVMQHREEMVGALMAGLQVRTGARSSVSGKVQVNNRGNAQLGVKLRSDHHQWLAALAALVPLGNWTIEAVQTARARRRDERARLQQQEQRQQEQLQQEQQRQQLQQGDGA